MAPVFVFLNQFRQIRMQVDFLLYSSFIYRLPSLHTMLLALGPPNNRRFIQTTRCKQHSRSWSARTDDLGLYLFPGESQRRRYLIAEIHLLLFGQIERYEGIRCWKRRASVAIRLASFQRSNRLVVEIFFEERSTEKEVRLHLTAIHFDCVTTVIDSVVEALYSIVAERSISEERRHDGISNLEGADDRFDLRYGSH